MSEQFNEQISEFIDDEMLHEEGEFFVRRLQRDEAARARYLRYQLIGAAARGEYLHPGAADFGQRLERAIDRDTTAGWLASRPMRLASGAGIAASVVLVVLFGFKVMQLESDSQSLDEAVNMASGRLDLPRPVELQQLVSGPTEVTGIQMLIHHAGYTSGVSRTMMQSSVVAAQASDLDVRSEAESID